MAIAFDALGPAAAADIGAVSSKTVAITVGSGSNRLLVVGIPTRSGANNVPTGVTFNAVAMTLFPASGFTSSGRFLNACWYYMINPPTGTFNIIVSFTGTTTGGAVYGLSLTGVDQATPIEAVAGNNSLAAAPPWNASPTTITGNAWVANCFYSAAPGPITPANSETSRQTTIIGVGVIDDIAGFETKGPIVTPASTPNGWTDGTANTNEFVMSSIAIRPATAVLTATASTLLMMGA